MNSIMPCGCTWLCSARRLQIPDDDVWHAYENAIALVEIGEDPRDILWLGVMEIENNVLVLHAMALRCSTQREMFGGEDL